MQAKILCYHKVGFCSEEGRRLNIEPSRLSSHVRFFSRNNYKISRISDLIQPWQDKLVCFTFDDAYLSTMTHAPEIFEAVGARATFYAVPGRVGITSDWDGELARPLADWDLLRAAQKRGHEIGNHTMNHVHLDQVSETEQAIEIKSAHDRLTAEGIQSKSFCYPYGGHTPRTLEITREAGYEVGVILGKRIASDTDVKQGLPRIVVAYSDTLPMLLYKLLIKPKLKRSR